MAKRLPSSHHDTPSGNKPDVTPVPSGNNGADSEDKTVKVRQSGSSAGAGNMDPDWSDVTTVQDGLYPMHDDEIALEEERIREQEARILGACLSDKFEVLELLGKGGMSSVYKARNKENDEFVAVKVMHSHLAYNTDNLRRFRHEATAAKRISHANAIRIYDLGVTPDGSPFLVMDYLEGRSLAWEIRQKGKLPIDRCLDIFIQACDAMHEVHKHGILHRDLKPSNIVIVQDGEKDIVKLLDFGIAKLMKDGDSTEIERATPTGQVLGSPPYMSPEQCQGRTIDERSDIYSMGCLMYEALTGNPPLEGATALETMYKQMNEMPDGLSGIDPDIRVVQRLEGIVFKALAKQRENRYQTIEELKKDLDDVRTSRTGGLKIVAQVSVKTGQISRSIFNKLGSSKKIVFALAAALLLVVAASFLFFSPIYGVGADPGESERVITPERMLSIYARKPDDFSAKEGVLIARGKMIDAQFGDSSPEAFNFCKALGDFYRMAGKYSMAISPYGRALRISTMLKLDKSVEAAELCVSMGTCDLLSGRMKEALMCGASALNILKELGTGSTQVALPAMAIMEEAAWKIGDYGQANQIANEFVNTVRSHLGSARGRPEDLAMAYFAIAENRKNSRDPQNAEKLLKLAANAWRELGARGNFNFGSACNELGSVEISRGNYGKAINYFDRAEKQVVLAGRATDDVNVARILFNKADAQWRNNQWLEAIQTRAKARKIWNENKTDAALGVDEPARGN